jgi:hypothetical protein
MVPGEGMISFTNKVFLYKNLMSGQIPLWDSYAITGTPFLANSQSTFFYPLNALALFFPPTLFTNLYYLVHIGLAGYFIYF